MEGSSEFSRVDFSPLTEEKKTPQGQNVNICKQQNYNMSKVTDENNFLIWAGAFLSASHF